MLKDLTRARNYIIQAKRLLHRHFTKRLWPSFYEDPRHLIKDINDCIAAIRNGEPLPP